MRRRGAALALYSVLILASCSGRGSVSEQQTLQWRRPELGGEHLLRQHMWEVFANIMRENPQKPGQPAWTSWYPVSSLQSSTSRTMLSLGGIEIEFSVQGLAERARGSETPPGFASVYYNPAAFRHIKQYALDDPKQMEERARTSASIPEFPPEAMVIKTIWVTVRLAKHNTGSVPSCIPVFKSDVLVTEHLPGHVIREDNHDYFRYVAAVFPQDWAEYQNTKQCYLSEWGSPEEASAVVQLDGSKFLAMPIQGDLTRQPAGLFDGQEGDALVLGGLQLTTKEVPEWTWATFWWDDQAPSSRMYRDRPENPKLWSKFENFVMDSTLALGACQPNGSFNPRRFGSPLLELHFDDGIHANCLVCHRQAVWGPDANPNVPSVKSCPTPEDLKGKMTLDFLWTLHRTPADPRQPAK